MALTSAGAAAYRCHGADGKVTYSDRACKLSQHNTGKVDPSGYRRPPPAEAPAALLAESRAQAPIAAPAATPSAKAPAAPPAAPSLDLGNPGPGLVLTACKVLVVQCVNSPSKSVDGCFAAAPRCASARPWLDGGSMACCPQACAQQYEAHRKAGKQPLQAFDLVLYGDGSASSCVPAR